jgi:hypothetical protein
MDRHIGTAITDTVTANPGMAASSGPSRFRSGVRTGAYPFEDAHVRSMSTFGTDEHRQVCRSAAPVACEARAACGPVGLGGGVGGVTGVGVTTGGSVRAVSFLGSRFRSGMSHRPDNRSTATIGHSSN